MLKEKNPKLWFVSNLFGINMMPTVLVYLGMIPAYYFIQSNADISLYNVIGFIICMASVTMQLISDTQMARHRAKKSGTNIESGLWAYSRHPNYFGEVMFWWGLFIMTIGLAAPFVCIAGAVAITLLFIFISIPMMERHVEAKISGYSEYKAQVSMLVPWFNKR
jgi:steroid 5-alpha reductase family enzyme